MKPVDSKTLFPDGPDEFDINGVRVRKGSIGACIANVKRLNQPDITPEERSTLIKHIEASARQLEQAFEFTKVFSWRDPEVQAIFVKARKQLDDNS